MYIIVTLLNKTHVIKFITKIEIVPNKMISLMRGEGPPKKTL